VFKDDVKKGGNRICTFLYVLLRRIKFSRDHCQKGARHLILMGDNYTENKCNLLFAFCCLLIYLGWFDVVELMYGPVGHTHNGNDSVHHCHNNMAANFDIVTLAEFIQKFDYAWNKLNARPQAVFFEDSYDFESWMDDFMNHVGGFTATSYSELYVRAVKFEKGPSGKVEMHFKGSPTNAQWRGVGIPDEKYPDCDGLVVLDRVPPGTPTVIPHNALSKTPELTVKQLRHPKLVDRAKISNLRGSLQWVIDAVTTGRLPTQGPSQYF